MKKTIDLELIVNDREDLKEIMLHMLYKPSVVLTGLSNDNYEDTINYKLRFKAELILPDEQENNNYLAVDGKNTNDLNEEGLDIVYLD